MATLQLLIAQYCDQYEEWPESLEEIKQRHSSPNLDLSKYMANPLTGDDPGYEYVKPNGKWRDFDFDDQQIILYQLRDGKRDTSLEVGYADLSIRPLVENGQSATTGLQIPPAKTAAPVPPTEEQKSLLATISRGLTQSQLDLGQPIINSIGMVFVPIPAGEFWMGSSDSDENSRRDEKPRHLVKITKPFYMSTYTVTQQQYEMLMGVHPWNDPPYVQEGPDYPATLISWTEAMVFCRKLSQQEGVNYRLPTEAEWEYSCRAGTTAAFSFGDDESELGKYAWYEENTKTVGEAYVHRVGKKLPNPWGLYDMHGNAFEWCQDWFAFTYGSKLAVVDPVNTETADFRTIRGGSFGSDASGVRSANRMWSREYMRDVDITFRVVREYTFSR